MTDQYPTPPPSISVRATFRQIGEGPEEIEVRWEAGTAFPAAGELRAVVAALAGIRRTEEASDR